LASTRDEPTPENGWVAVVSMCTYSVQTLANFRLDTLKRRNVGSCKATNRLGRYVFLYDLVGNNNYNCFVDELHPSYGSR
jgi:hypothetical protein